MFRNRYLTTHETADAIATRMRRLSFVSYVAQPGKDSTYRVVAFIVNVKLVEKRAKRKVGSVIVVKVISQINVPGTALAMSNRP